MPPSSFTDIFVGSDIFVWISSGILPIFSPVVAFFAWSLYRGFARIPMKHLEHSILSISRTLLNAVRLTVLWLGVSLFATGADATTIPPTRRPVCAGCRSRSPGESQGEAVRDRQGPSPSGAHSCRPREGRRASARALAEARTPRYRTDAGRQRRARHPRGCRHRLRPLDRQGALRRKLNGRALDRQHHEGDDRDRVPRDRDRSQRGSPDCPLRHAPRLDDVSPHERSRSRRRSVAPAADFRPTTPPPVPWRASRRSATTDSSRE